MLITGLQAHAVVPDRITQQIRSGVVTRMSGNIHPMARPEFDQGAVDPSMVLNRITIFFSRTQAQQADLDQLLKDQQDPASPSYHQWLTPEQFDARFGISQNDYNKVEEWLTSQGFSIVTDGSSRSSITFSGRADQVQSTFRTELHLYNANGKVFFANATEPSIPVAISGVVTGIHGLNSYRPKPRLISHPRFTSNISGSHFIVPDDVAAIYDLAPLYSAGIDGSGQTIAIMGQTDLTTTPGSYPDVDEFRSNSGLPANHPTVVTVPGCSGTGVISGDIDEANLDVEWAGAVARKATIIFVEGNANSNNCGAFDALLYSIQNNVAPVISISYGDCEPDMGGRAGVQSFENLFQQAGTQGQTIIGPSGDDGAADCDYTTDSNNPVNAATHGLAIDYPGSSQYVTSIGGTTFNDGTGLNGTDYWSATNTASNASALFYIPEVAWNDTTASVQASGGLAATGGGKSILFPKPSWQTGSGVPNDSARDVPDISFNASPFHDEYLICSQGWCNHNNGFRLSANDPNDPNGLDAVGGTSVGVPVFAGIVALMNQKLGTAQGNVKTRLYALASSQPAIFHDVITGDNKVPCLVGSTGCASGGSIGYTANAGFDLVTGWGSVDGFSLVSSWSASSPAPDFSAAFSNSTLNLTHSTTGTANLAISSLNGFNGTVTFKTCIVPASLTNTTCTVSPSTVSGNGTMVVTIANTSTAALHPPAGLPFRRSLWLENSFGVAALLLVGGKRSRRRQMPVRIGMVAVFVLCLFALTSCGGGNGTSTSQKSSDGSTFTAMSGPVVVQVSSSTGQSHAATLNVTVN